MTASYGLICICATYLLKMLKDSSGPTMDASEMIGKVLSQGMQYILIPIQDFFLTSHLATGQLLEFSTIGELVLYNLVLRGLPLFLLGTYLYWRRELALAMKR